MRRSLLRLVCLGLALGCGAPARVPSPRSVVVGWDGADWEALHALIDAGRMPNLARLVEEGSSGRPREYLSPPDRLGLPTNRPARRQDLAPRAA